MFETASGRLGTLARVSAKSRRPGLVHRPDPNPQPAKAKPPTHGRVVHLVGRLTEPVFGFLRPATEAIARAGTEQCVVLLDEPRLRHLLLQFEPGVQVVCTPNEPGLLRRWLAARDIFRQVLAERPTEAVHFHGVSSWLLGAGIARRVQPPLRRFYSPHGSVRSGPGRPGGLSRWLPRWFQGGSVEQTIVKLDMESRSVSALGGGHVGIIEAPVGRAFLQTPANPARRPLVVTSSRVELARSALAFAQLAVLLGDKSLGLSFNWIGAAAPQSLAALKAANVAVFDVKDELERARRLSSGWVYLAVGDAPGFPLFLVEAMALGLPCIAMETPFTRAVIRHGETGFLCRNSTDVRQAIAELIDGAELRQRLGSAARLDARQRFGEGRFCDSVLSAYALPSA